MTGRARELARKALVIFLSFAMVSSGVPTQALAEALEPGQATDEAAQAEEEAQEEVTDESPAAEDDAANAGDATADAQSADQDQPQANSPPAEGAATDQAQASDAPTDEAPAQEAADEPSMPAFDQEAQVEGTNMLVRVQADEGTFPEGARLEASQVQAQDELDRAEEAVAEQREDGTNVAKSLTLDVRVVNTDGNELQPAEGKQVSVSFKSALVANNNLTTSVYHVTEAANDASLEAEELKVEESKADDELATVQTNGFSYYTVEFTYGDLQYVMQGDTTIPLQDVLDYLKLTGTVEAVEVSAPDLFSASKNDNGTWQITAHQAFSSQEWMKVTLDGVVFDVVVTDSYTGLLTNSDFNSKVKEGVAGGGTSRVTLKEDVSGATLPQLSSHAAGVKQLIINLAGYTLDVSSFGHVGDVASASQPALLRIIGPGTLKMPAKPSLYACDGGKIEFQNLTVDFSNVGLDRNLEAEVGFSTVSSPNANQTADISFSGCTFTKSGYEVYNLYTYWKYSSRIYFYATPPTYNIKYMMNGGTNNSSNPSTYKYGVGATILAPTRTCYDFLGWTGNDINSPMETIAISTTSTGDKSYEAQWELASYTITYSYGDFDGTDNPESYNITSDSFTLNNPEGNDDYEFDGWTGTGLSGKTKTVTISKGSTGNRTYTANWKPRDYSITYDLADGSIPRGKSNPATYNKDSGAITLVNPTRTYYDFAGWTGTGLGELTTTVTIPAGAALTDKARAYTAHWTPTNYTIQYNIEHGHFETDNPTSYNYESETFTLNNPISDEGYKFVGWRDSSGNVSSTVTISKGSSGNKTYTAVFGAKEYSITYNLGHWNAENNPNNPTTYTADTNTFTLGHPTLEGGYYFLGWKDESGNVERDVTIQKGTTGNLAFEAVWKDIVQRTIWYDYKGDAFWEMRCLGVSPTEPSENRGSYVQYQDAAFKITDPTCEAFEFAGWDVWYGSMRWYFGYGDGKRTKDLTFEFGTEEDLDLCAHWRPKKYKITYNLNGGSGSGYRGDFYDEGSELRGDLSYLSHDYADKEYPTEYFAAEKISFDGYEPVREGYDFEGWVFTKADSSEVVCENSNTIENVYGDLVATATWSVDRNKYSIDYDLNDYDLSIWSGYNSQNPWSFDIESDFYIEDVSANGYEFVGWKGYKHNPTSNSWDLFTGEEPIKRPHVSSGTNTDLLFVAYWRKATYTLQFDLDGGSRGIALDGHTFFTWHDNVADAYHYGDYPSTYDINSDYTIVSPTKGDYKFLGWEVETEGVDESFVLEPDSKGSKSIGISFLALARNGKKLGNAKYTALWGADPEQFKITYNLNDGEVVSENPAAYGIESSFTLNNPVRDHYEFLGWTGTDLTEPSLRVEVPVGSAGDREYTANWRAIESTITYNLAGGEDPGNPTKYTVEDEITLLEPVRPGYKFLGWTGTDLTEQTVEVTIQKGSYGDRTYTAAWVEATYKISYDWNGGSDGDANPRFYTYFDDTFALVNPTRKDYKFVGWSGTGLDEVTDEVVIEKGSWGDRIYRALWAIEGDDHEVTSWKQLQQELLESSRIKLTQDLSDDNNDGCLLIKSGSTVTLDMSGYTLNRKRTQYESQGQVFRMEPGSRLTIIGNGGKIIGGMATDDGGAIYCNGGLLSFSDVEISGNKTLGEGGGLFLNGSTASFSEDVVVQDNYAQNGGGGVWLRSSSTLNLGDNAQVVNNQSESTVGGIGFDTNSGHNVLNVYGSAVVNGNSVGEASSNVLVNEGLEHIGVIGSLNSSARIGVSVDGFNPYDITEGYISNTEKDPSKFFYSDNPEKWYVGWNKSETEAFVYYRPAISFDANGGEGEMSSIQVTGYPSGADGYFHVNLPTNTFTREGYTFKCWSLSPDEEQYTARDQAEVRYSPYGAEALVPDASDKTYYAIWEADTYNITYESNGGDMVTANLSAYNPSSYTTEDDVIRLFVPPVERPGYAFEKWTGDGIYDDWGYWSFNPRENTGDRIFTAMWKPTQYKIRYDPQGGVDAATNPLSYTIETDTFTLDNPTRNGYEFAGWTGGGLTEATIDVTIRKGSTGDRIYTARWTPVDYTISYNLDAGTLPEGKTNPTSYNITTSNFTLNNPTKEGYTFTGWTGTGLTDPTTSVTVARGNTGNRAYTANWDVNSYTIKYNLAGGTLEKANPGIYTYESDDITLTNPTRDGYEFAGWTGDGLTEATKDVTISKGSTGNRTYTATWETKAYTITYSGVDDANNNKNPSEYTIRQTVNLSEPTRTGYTFDGWTGTDINGTSKSITIPLGSTGDRSFTAHWTPITYTITCDLDGGTLDDGVTNDQEYNILSGPITLAAPTKEGYTFRGWTGTGLNKVSSEVTISTGSTGNRTYTAHWDATGYKITYEGVDGAYNPNPGTYTKENETFSLEDPSKSGYTFHGWTGGTVPDDTPVKGPKIIKGSTGELTFTAHWVPQYAITYHLGQDGVNAESNPSYYDELCDPITLADPTRYGYEFTGWSETENDTPSTTVIIPTGSTGEKTYYANWQKATYTITYNLDGGTETSNPTAYTVDSPDIILASPTKEGYEFGGWSGTSIDGVTTGAVTIPQGSAGNRSYTANWDAKKYTVKFNLDGGTYTENGRKIDGKTYTVEQKDFKLGTPTKKGYTFKGWTGEGITAPSTDVTVGTSLARDLEYTAVWEAKGYTITYELNGGTTTNRETYTPDDEDFTLNNPTRDGYTFTGWLGSYLNNTLTTEVTIAKGSTGDREYRANWTPTEYTIIYDLNDGANSLKATATGNNPTTYTIESNTFTLSNPTRTGYTFAGWMLNGSTEASEEVTIAKGGAVGNRTYKAKWNPLPYNITYTLGAGGVNHEDNPTTYGPDDENITLKAPTRNGYKFTGWTGDTPGGALAETVTIESGSYGVRSYTANWKAEDYTITYDLAEGKLADGVSNPTTYDVETATFTLNNPTREHYTFAGWTGTGITGEAQKTVTVKNGSSGKREYTATWTPVDYTISYEYNGGHLEGADTKNPDSYHIESENITLKNPERTGYDFKGWSGTDLTGDENTSVTIETGSTGNRAYVANWTPAKYTITYDLDGGSEPSDPNPTEYTIESAPIKLKAPTKYGFDFVGWKENNGGEAQETVTIPTGSHENKSYTAVWETAKYTLNAEPLSTGTNTNPLGTVTKSQAPYLHNSEVTVSVEDLSTTGHRFIGWYNASDIVDGKVKEGAEVRSTDLEYKFPILGNEDLRAVYEDIAPHTVTFNTIPGTGATAVTGQMDTLTVYDGVAANLTKNAFVRAGYDFGGWNSSNDGTGDSYADESSVTLYGDLTLYAQWAPKTYTITYVVGDGGSYEGNTTKYTPDTSNFSLVDPTRAGYTFTGWTGEGFNNPTKGITIQNGSIGNRTYTANWNTIEYKLTFRPNGGTFAKDDVHPATYTVETTDICVSNPTRTGYTFDGWTGPGLDTATKELVIQKGSIENRTYEAQWTANTYTITYNMNGGTNNEANPLTYTIEEAEDIVLKAPAKTGYAFAGWTDDSVEGDTKHDSITIQKGSHGNRSFTANWTPIEYEITYTLDSGSLVEGVTNPSKYTIEDTFTLNNPVRAGYTFQGWTGTDLNEKEQRVTVPAGKIGDRSYVANWAVETFTIDYDFGGGSDGNVNRRSYTYESPQITLADPSREGYTFAGWTEDSVDEEDAEPHAVTIPTHSLGNRKYTAHWTPIVYTITYGLDGGHLEGGETNPSTYTIVDGAITLNNPVKTGYTFKGWTGSDYANPAMTVEIPMGSTGNRTFTAHWERDTYTISYAMNGGTNAYGNPEEYTYESEDIVLADPSRTYYTFKGWSGTDLNGDENKSVTIAHNSTGARSFTANWTPIEYDITYDTKGGKLEGDATNPSTYNYETGTFTLNNPAKTGYTFTGWTGGGNNEPQTTVTIEQGSHGVLSYTANWSRDTYQVTYANMEGATNDPSNPATYTYEDPAHELANPTKDGYTFEGWLDVTNGEEDAQKVTSIPEHSTGDRTLKATWEPITYTIDYTLDGGEFAEDAKHPKEFTIEDADIEVSDPVKTGYTFTGWTGPDYATPMKSIVIGHGSTQSRTYVANWSLNTYHVTYANMEGATNAYGNPATYTYEDPAHELANPTKDGYTFEGWTLTTQNGDPVTQIANHSTGDITLWANWKPITYTITYTLGGGALANGQMNLTEYTIETESFTLKVPERTNYNFKGWKGTGIEGDDPQQSVTIEQGSTGNRSYVAQWEAGNHTLNVYTLAMDDDGDVIEADMGTATISEATVSDDDQNETEAQTETQAVSSGAFAHGQILTVATPAQTVEGYAFAGWYNAEVKDGKAVGIKGRKAVSNSPIYVFGITKNTDLVALYERVATSAITFDANSEDVTNANAMPKQSVYQGVATTINENKFERQGYDFAGWNTEYDGTGTPYGNKQRGVQIWDDLYLYAQWTPQRFYITYELDGGSIASTNPESFTRETAEFTLVNPTKQGYTFAGWTGTGLEDATQTVTIEKGSSGNRTYTATWTATEYTITYELDGGTVEGTNRETYNADSGPIKLINPTKTGYTFLGWEGTGISGRSTDVTISTGSTGDRKYTAVWDLNKYTITYDLDGGKAPEYVSEYTVVSNSITIPNPEKTANTFEGWTITKTSESGVESTVTFNTDESGNTVIPTGTTGNFAFKANWNAKKFTVGAYSRSSGSSTPVAHIAIDDKAVQSDVYDYGDKVTLTARVTDSSQWKFSGWYEATALETGSDGSQYVSKHGSKVLSYDTTFTLTVEDDINVVAIFDPLGKRKLTVDVVNGAEYYVNDDKAVQRGSSYTVDYGERITLTAKDSTRLMYWTNNSYMIIGYGQSVNLTMTTDQTVRLYYSPEVDPESGQCYVQFLSNSDQVIRYYQVSPNSVYVDIPNGPIEAGKEFEYWKFEDTGKEVTGGKDGTLISRIKTGSDAMITIRPEYKNVAEEDKKYGSVTIHYLDETGKSIKDAELFTSSKYPDGKIPEGDYVKVSVSEALEVDDDTYKFVRWVDSSDEKATELGNNPTVEFTIRGNHNLYARYTDSGTTVEKKPTVWISYHNAKYESSAGKYVLMCTVKWDVPEGYTVEEAGLLYGADVEKWTSGMMLLENVDNTSLFKYDSGSREPYGDFTENMYVGKQTASRKWRGYLVFRKGDLVDTIYTDNIVSGSYNTIKPIGV